MAQQHHYLTVRGSYGTPTLQSESWQFGIRLATIFGPVADFGTLSDNWTIETAISERALSDGGVRTNYLVNGPFASSFSPDDWLQDVAAPAVDTLFTKSFIPDGIQVEELRLHPITAPTGRVLQTLAGPAVATRYWTSGYPTGTSTSNLLPPQNSIVCSLRSNRGGRKGRGRCYFPCPPVSSISTDGTYTSSSSLATAFATFVSALATKASGQDADMSPVVTGKPYETYGRVVFVEVGNRVDTQRRRRRSLAETYSQATV